MKNTRILLLIVLWYLSSGSALASQQKDNLAESVDSHLNQAISGAEPLRNIATEWAFAKVLRSAGLSGGIIQIQECQSSTSKSTILHSGEINGLTVRQALDRLVNEDPSYKWELRDGAVDLVPAKGIPTIFNIKIDQFDLSAKDVVTGVGARLFEEPAVETALAEMKLKKEDKLQTYIGGRPPEFGKAVQFKHATVMEILNSAAVTAKYSTIWRYTQTIGNCERTYYLDWPVN